MDLSRQCVDGIFNKSRNGIYLVVCIGRQLIVVLPDGIQVLREVLNVVLYQGLGIRGHLTVLLSHITDGLSGHC